MKKIILSVLVLSTLYSCKKDTCWRCTYGITMGVQRPDATICTEGEEPPQQYDAAGNAIGQNCVKQ